MNFEKGLFLKYTKVFFKGAIIMFLSIIVISLIIAMILRIEITQIALMFVAEYKWVYTMIAAIACGIGDAFHSRTKSKEISIDNKEDFLIRLKKILRNSKWKITNNNEKFMEIQPRVINNFIYGKVTINISDDHICLSGAKILIEDIGWDIEN